MLEFTSNSFFSRNSSASKGMPLQADVAECNAIVPRTMGMATHSRLHALMMLRARSHEQQLLQCTLRSSLKDDAKKAMHSTIKN